MILLFPSLEALATWARFLCTTRITSGVCYRIFRIISNSALGLYVQNKNGVVWKAYGDKHYWTSENRANRVQIALALQASVDEIKEVYFTGKPVPLASFAALNYVPDLNKLLDVNATYGPDHRKNHSPLVIADPTPGIPVIFFILEHF